MEYGKGKKKLNGIASALLVCAFVMLNSITVLAYEEVSVALVPSAEEIMENKTLDIAITPIEEPYTFIDAVLYDEQFVDEDGNIYPVGGKTNTYANCNHTYKAGKYEKHEKKNDGSCTITYYESQYCTKCGNYTLGKQVGISSFLQCFH